MFAIARLAPFVATGGVLFSVHDGRLSLSHKVNSQPAMCLNKNILLAPRSRTFRRTVLELSATFVDVHSESLSGFARRWRSSTNPMADAGV